ncbi:MAG: HD domain-containing protein [Chloroflexi bacterium]|nr:HD domain-containing protein [Chloroflexota bacterium]
MPPAPEQKAIRMADLLGAFSFASSLGRGAPPEHGARCCHIGMHIGRELALSSGEQTNLYYAELLKDSGCTAWTSKLAAFWLTDEIAARRAYVALNPKHPWKNPSNPLKLLSWLMKYVGVGAPLATRAGMVMEHVRRSPEFLREGFENACHVASRIAQRLDMPQPVQDALMHTFEQWDGNGLLYGTKGEAIPLISRIVGVTCFVEGFHRMGGREAAKQVVIERRGEALDPTVVDAFLSASQDERFWEGLEQEPVWDRVRSMEPEGSPHRYFVEDKLWNIALALADFADLHLSSTAAHSRRVAETADRIARRMAAPQPEVEAVRYAALLHDVGIVTVSSFVLSKPEDQLTDAEREQMHLHPYHSERILSRVPAFKFVAPLVAAHHERMDGQGYYRRLPGTQIPLGARIIAVADRFDELVYPLPNRAVLDVEQVVGVMRHEVGRRLCPDAFQAFAEELEGAAPVPKARRSEWPAGLTDREVEVLRLVGRALSRREVADALFVSESTVRHHLEHIYSKIGVSTRAAAILYAMEHGLLN